MMINAIIIEDEVNSRDLLQQMLEEYCEDVNLLGLAQDVSSGIELIKKTNPDIVFLDIEMPGGNGFDILDVFNAPKFKVIFTTGYNHYAIKAIKYAALDYLLKPINLRELRQALEKAKNSSNAYQNSLSFFKNNVTKEPEEIDQIVVSDNKTHQVIKISDIVFIEAHRSYAIFHLDNSQKLTTAYPLQYYEGILPEDCFFRIHKSYLVNCLNVVKLESGRGGAVHLSGGVVLPVAFRRKPAFVKFLDKIA